MIVLVSAPSRLTILCLFVGCFPFIKPEILQCLHIGMPPSAEKILGGAWHAQQVLSGAPSGFRKYETPGEPKFSLYAYNVRLQGLNFGVQFNLLQIVLSVQLPRSADWGMPRTTGQRCFKVHIPLPWGAAACVPVSHQLSLQFQLS